MINQLNAIGGTILYLLSLIKREELVQELLVMDIEEGGEVLIPK